MGTSSARKAPVGKFWRTAKTFASRFASGKDPLPSQVNEVVARYLTALESHNLEGIEDTGVLLPDVVQAAASLGNFYRLWEQEGWDAALQNLGLNPAAHQTREEIIPALLDKLAGPGSRLNQAVARTALIDHLERVFFTPKNTPQTGGASGRERPEPWSEVHNFLGLALFRQYLSDLGEPLEFHAPNMNLGFKRQGEIKSHILGTLQTLESAETQVEAFSFGQTAARLERLISILGGRHER